MRVMVIPMRCLLLLAAHSVLAAQSTRSPEYDALQHRLAQGWNTWDVHSVAAQVLLPDGFTIRTGILHNTALTGDAFLADALIGRQSKGAEQVFPGPHTWTGSYTEIELTWHDHNMRLESAHDGADLVMMATPLASKSTLPPTLVFSAGVLWNRPGSVTRAGGRITFQNASRHTDVFLTAK